jgi:hypothetical protein
MKRTIVTTTINAPTEALRRYAAMEAWDLLVVADKRTPVDRYADLNCHVMTCEEQSDIAPELSELVGWSCIQRRNFGFIKAYADGADVVATVDDDNIPYEFWSDDLVVGQELTVDQYTAGGDVADPLSVTSVRNLWHRGFPIQRLSRKNEISYLGRQSVRVDVQAALWDGDPDIDAICRMMHRPNVKIEIAGPFAFTDRYVPFNSQNTALSREMLPYYMCLPGIGRMDDIWGAYLLQQHKKPNIVFTRASVFQARNEHDLSVDFGHEVVGYTKTDSFLKAGCDLSILQNGDYVAKCFDLYQKAF